MVELLRSGERRHVRHDKHEIWNSFFSDGAPGALTSGFGLLGGFDEFLLQPGASTDPRCEHETEIVTYVYKGALSQEDTLGNSGVLHTGEFQRMSAGSRTRHKETSVSRTDSVHFFRMSLAPAQAGLDRDHEQKRFTEAQRRNMMCVVVSPDGRRGSLRITQDAFVFSAILHPGRHLVHELEPGRTAWLHAVCGYSTLNGIVMTQGDGIGIVDERAVSLTVQEKAEILLVDLGPKDAPPWDWPPSGEGKA